MDPDLRSIGVANRPLPPHIFRAGLAGRDDPSHTPPQKHA
jgi:hypothetical protein